MNKYTQPVTSTVANIAGGLVVDDNNGSVTHSDVSLCSTVVEGVRKFRDSANALIELDSTVLSPLQRILEHSNRLQNSPGSSSQNNHILILGDELYQSKVEHLWEELVGQYRRSIRKPQRALFIRNGFNALSSYLSTNIEGEAKDTVFYFSDSREKVEECKNLCAKYKVPLIIFGNTDGMQSDLQGLFVPVCVKQLSTKIKGELDWSIQGALASLLLHIFCEAYEPDGFTKRSVKNVIEEAVESCSLTIDDEDFSKSLEQLEADLLKIIKPRSVITISGNGGSSCDANELCHEWDRVLAKKFNNYTGPEKVMPLQIMPLCVPGYLTCVANDFGFSYVFSRAVLTLKPSLDILICITTSGNSENIYDALIMARNRGVYSILLSGNSGGRCKDFANSSVLVKALAGERMQELHHIFLCSMANWLGSLV